MIPQLHGWEATKPPPWRWCVAPWHCGDAMPWRWGRAFMRDWRGLQGENEGKTFLLFLLKGGENRADLQSMGKNTIIKTVAVVAFAAAALGNAVVLEQSNTVTWLDALHALSMLIGSLVAVAIPFVELPE